MSPTRPLPEPPLAVGNDVVDLSDPRCQGKHREARFLERVLAPAEREAVARAPDPARALWLHWAAKEAAYKVVSKLPAGRPPFEHAAFVVDGPGGLVGYGAARVPFRARREGDLLHVVAVDPRLPAWPGADGVPRLRHGARDITGEDDPSGRGGAWERALRERFTDLERAAVHSAASARVRLEARAHLARELHLDEARLQIVCRGGPTGRTPPVPLLDDERAPADVSLSHHGRWIGWALLLWG